MDTAALYAAYGRLTVEERSWLHRWALDRDSARAFELSRVLGERWAICRDTPKNRRRYFRCLTNREYQEATRVAIKERARLAALVVV